MRLQLKGLLWKMKKMSICFLKPQLEARYTTINGFALPKSYDTEQFKYSPSLNLL